MAHSINTCILRTLGQITDLVFPKNLSSLLHLIFSYQLYLKRVSAQKCHLVKIQLTINMCSTFASNSMSHIPNIINVHNSCSVIHRSNVSWRWYYVTNMDRVLVWTLYIDIWDITNRIWRMTNYVEKEDTEKKVHIFRSNKVCWLSQNSLRIYGMCQI